MLYSGADLIRTSGQQQERQERLKVLPQVKPAAPVKETSTALEENTQGALLRFARFVQNEKGSKQKPKERPKGRKLAGSVNPYNRHIDRQAEPEPRGQTLNIIV